MVHSKVNPLIMAGFGAGESTLTNTSKPLFCPRSLVSYDARMRFTIGQLFASVTLIAIGLGMAWPIIGKRTPTGLDFVACPLAASMLGAGLLNLVNRPMTGALVGLAMGLMSQAVWIVVKTFP
jgi:hypothetical protein